MSHQLEDSPQKSTLKILSLLQLNRLDIEKMWDANKGGKEQVLVMVRDLARSDLETAVKLRDLAKEEGQLEDEQAFSDIVKKYEGLKFLKEVDMRQKPKDLPAEEPVRVNADKEISVDSMDKVQRLKDESPTQEDAETMVVVSQVVLFAHKP